MNRKQAAEVIKLMVASIGPGYHPDTPFTDYINSKGKPSFCPVEAKHLQFNHDKAMTLLGEEAYVIGLETTKELYGP